METSGGNVRIGDVKGVVDVETSGGEIELGAVEGRVHAETSGGNIRLKVAGGNEGIYAETSGGNIEVMIGKNVGAEIDAATSGGDVECDLPVTMKGKVSDSELRGKVNGGGKKIYAHTSGGNVRIKAIP
jgi:lia operon protein LiaG